MTTTRASRNRRRLLCYFGRKGKVTPTVDPTTPEEDFPEKQEGGFFFSFRSRITFRPCAESEMK